MLRIDAAIARLAMTQVRNGNMRQFMPWPKESDEATPKALHLMFKNLASKTKKAK